VTELLAEHEDGRLPDVLRKAREHVSDPRQLLATFRIGRQAQVLYRREIRRGALPGPRRRARSRQALITIR
jgi:hypothetical protein